MNAPSRRHIHAVLAVLAAAALAMAGRPAGAEEPGSPRAVRNVIVMISDGCGFNHVQAASLYASGRPVSFAFQRFPIRLAMKTDALTWRGGGRVAPAGYDPERSWREFDHVKSGYTDSAASGTAMAAGVKSYNGAIGMTYVVDEHGVVQKDPAGENAVRPARSVLQACEELGMATGVVTSVQFAHATPACFVAHNPARGNYAEIAREMILESPVDVIMGCGHPHYRNGGRPTDDPISYQYVGGEDTWRTLAAGQAGADVDADHNGVADDAWQLVQTRDEFQTLAAGPTPKRVIGVPHAHSTLQQGRPRSEEAAAPFDDPLTEGVPTLAEMTAAALNVLDEDPDGLFLMVEGGAVDWASHSNQSGRMIEEQLDFANAVQAVIDWVDETGGWDETVLIVTGDHETGYVTRAAQGDPDADVPWAWQPLGNNGRGRLPAMAWHSGSHTNSLIPFYARGAGCRRFRDAIAGTDPHRGDYIDNTAIARVIFALLQP